MKNKTYKFMLFLLGTLLGFFGVFSSSCNEIIDITNSNVTSTTNTTATAVPEYGVISTTFSTFTSTTTFTTCETGVYEYGAPHAEYKLSGTVLSKITQNPIEGIEISFANMKVLANSLGQWQLNVPYAMPCYSSCYFEVKDIDGFSNGGLFQSMNIPFTPQQTDPGDGSTWDHGTWEAHGISIEMEELSND